MTQQKEQQKKLLSEIMEADQKNGLYDNHIVETNKMVTAVDWFYQQTVIEGKTNYWELLGQAKQMEKEQKIEFAKHCLDRALDLDIRTAFFNVEEYYKQTYGRNTK